MGKKKKSKITTPTKRMKKKRWWVGGFSYREEGKKNGNVETEGSKEKAKGDKR